MKRLLTFRILASIGVTMLALAVTAPRMQSITPPDAPTGLAAVSNGFAEEFCANQASMTNAVNSPQIPADECNFDAAAEEFLGPETEADGLGPIFNMAGCGECHFTPALGGSSHISEKRAGFFNGNVFIDHPGGSLIQDRATNPNIQETVISSKANVTTLRMSLGIFGDGFVEAIANQTLQDIAKAQPFSMRGDAINVPVLEKPRQNRVGRFGWKAQQASLLSFSADAYVNEMGITSPLQPDENTSNGNSVAAHDKVPAGHPNDPDDLGVDVELFALFMRSLPAPAQDAKRAATVNAQIGASLFNSIGCDTCHTSQMVTAAPGTWINGGALKVANALGNKTIRPFGDFLLHDIGTGDGIVQNGGQGTRNKVRTAPLWGLRTRGRLMHDGASLNVTDAIQRHGIQADKARDAFNLLSSSSKAKLIEFLMSL